MACDSHRSAPRALLAGALSLVLLCACDDLGDFRTGDGEVFAGEVVGSNTEQDKPSFIRQGFDSHTRMELTFDPSVAAAQAAAVVGGETTELPGTLHTFTCPQGPSCAVDEREPGPLDHAGLEPIANLPHDPLSQYDFPGGGRIRNYIFGVRFETDGARRNAMVFLSLMEDRSIEVRVIGPSLLDETGEAELQPALFGFFRLERQAAP